MTRHAKQHGLTLVEVMIALLVFALIASASVYALRLGVDSRDQLSEVDANLRALQLARVLIKDDLAQVVNRPVRDEFGVAKPAAFSGGQITFGSRAEDDEQILVEFVRGGWLNPNASDPRSTLQHIKYIFRQGTLWRRSYDYLDETENANFSERVLFDNLEDASASFLNGEFRGEPQWADAWPLGPGETAGPKAIAIDLTPENGTPFRQLFWIGSIGAAPQ